MPIAPQSNAMVFAGSAEQALLADVYDVRRLQVLRIIVPGLLIFFLLNAPFTLVNTSIGSAVPLGIIGAILLAVGWATYAKQATLASLLLLFGMLFDTMLVIILNGPLQGPLRLGSLPQFFLLVIPIALSGVLTGPTMVLVISCLSLVFTVATLLLAPIAPGLHFTLQNQGNAALVSSPLLAQLGIGFLMFAGTYGFRRMQAELANLRIAYEREKELERLQELFISKVNHELRTPIMALQGYITLADELRQRGDMQGVEEMLHDGKEVAENLSQIVKSILNVRRVKIQASDMKIKPIPLRSVLERTVDVQQLNSLQQHRDIRIEGMGSVAVQADEERLGEVLSNLLSNAVKYSPNDTPIEIKVRVIPASDKRRNHEQSLPQVDIAIRDYGLGIPSEQAPLIFAPFVRLERDIASSVQGTGLGLAICAAHMQAMGGSIWVESAGVAGEGSAFHVALPLANTATLVTQPLR